MIKNTAYWLALISPTRALIKVTTAELPPVLSLRPPLLSFVNS